MTAITYIAKRSLVEGAFRVVGTDIGADGTLDQFGSTLTDLSGLAVNNYITVSGFTNAANNGWHIVSGTSTTTVLPVTASALVTEAAGATITIQQYERMAGLSYQVESAPAELTIWEKGQTSDSISQGGLDQSIMHRVEHGWTYRSDYLPDADIPQWREFLHSHMAKEPFGFDPYGTIAAPDNPVPVVLVGSPNWTRLNRYYWQVSFRVREI